MARDCDPLRRSAHAVLRPGNARRNANYEPMGKGDSSTVNPEPNRGNALSVGKHFKTSRGCCARLPSVQSSLSLEGGSQRKAFYGARLAASRLPGFVRRQSQAARLKKLPCLLPLVIAEQRVASSSWTAQLGHRRQGPPSSCSWVVKGPPRKGEVRQCPAPPQVLARMLRSAGAATRLKIAAALGSGPLRELDGGAVELRGLVDVVHLVEGFPRLPRPYGRLGRCGHNREFKTPWPRKSLPDGRLCVCAHLVGSGGDAVLFAQGARDRLDRVLRIPPPVGSSPAPSADNGRTPAWAMRRW